MCGIWGYLSKTNIYKQKQLYDAYTNVESRGPDKSDFLKISGLLNIYLGFHRLAIMDTTSNGDQPFKLEYEGRTIYCMCNGEIYNYKDLIKKYDLQLSSNSDCEVIPLLYLKIGMHLTVTELLGEFAFSIIDINHLNKITTIILGRDPIGIRPLYIGEDENGICFSSVKRGFISDFDTKHSEYIIKNNIREFEPGTFMTFNIQNDGDIRG